MRGSSAVYSQFISGTASALRFWLLTSVPTPICLFKAFSCKACPRIRTAGRGRAVLDANRTLRPGDKRFGNRSAIEDTSHYVSSEARTSENLFKPVVSKTRTYHGRFESARRTAGRRRAAGLAEQDADGSSGPEANRLSSPPWYRGQLF